MASRRSPSPNPLPAKRRRTSSSSPSAPHAQSNVSAAQGALKPDPHDPFREYIDAPTHPIGFHRSLQEISLGRVVRSRHVVVECNLLIASAKDGLALVEIDQVELSKHLQAHLAEVQANVLRANALIHITGRLSNEAAAIGTDVATLTGRYQAWLRDEYRPGLVHGAAERGTVFLTQEQHDALGQTSNEILDSAMLHGLFPGIAPATTDEVDIHVAWQRARADYAVGEDTFGFADNWAATFDMLNAASVRVEDDDGDTWPLPNELVLATAIKAHEPQKSDELRIKVGDRILQRKRYSDAWALGSIVMEDWAITSTGFYPIISLDVYSRRTAALRALETDEDVARVLEDYYNYVHKRDASAHVALDPPPPALVDATERHRVFRKAFSTFLRRIATEQVTRLIELRTLLTELSDTSARVQADQAANRDRTAALIDERIEWEQQLRCAEEKRPAAQRGLEAEILQLIILSRGS